MKSFDSEMADDNYHSHLTILDMRAHIPLVD